MKTILRGSGQRESFFLAKQTDGWVGFTQILTAVPVEVSSIEEGLKLCNPDEIRGLTFSLEEVPFIGTLLEMKIS